jgi:predicted permease
MSALYRLVHRIAALFRSDELDRQFDEEARAHIEFAVDDYIRQGLGRAEAERLARAKFGLVGASRDAHRDARSLEWLRAIVFDAQQAARSLSRDRDYAAIAIAMLTVALSLSTSVFAVMDAMLFRGFPLVQRNDRLVFLQERGAAGPRPVPYADVEEWRRQAGAFTEFAFVGGRPITFRDHDGRPTDMRVWQVDANTFSLLGVPPTLGRDFTTADQDPGAPAVVMLNHRFWRTRFHGRPDIVGTNVTVNERPAMIIGVMPERFDFPLKIDGDMWMPLVLTPALTRRGSHESGLAVVGRLRDGVSRGQGQADLETINRRIEADHPETNRGVVPLVMSHAYMNSGPHAAVIWGSLWAASVLVLIIAAANLANLALVRTVGRGRELATKLALGAGHMRIVRQLAFEYAAVATMSAALTWPIARWAVATWDAVTASQYQVLDYAVDLSAFRYLTVATVVTAFLIGVPSIARVLGAGSGGEFAKNGRRGPGGAPARRTGTVLVAVQMALAIVLLCGAGVLVRSFTAIVRADSGVRDPDHVLSGLMRMPSATYAAPESRQQYLDRLEATVRGVPGIAQVTLASTTPVRFAPLRPIEVEGVAYRENDPAIGVIRGGTEYFDVLGVAPVAGRVFSADDRPATAPVVIVNQSFAERFWAGQDPIGRRLRTLNPVGDWRVVVGVVPNVMQGDPLRQTFKPLVYAPVSQGPMGLNAYWMARSTGDPGAIAAAVRVAVEAVDRDVALANFLTLRASFAFDRDFMDLEHSELGKHARVAPVFAIVALLLAAIGLIAVVGYSVSQRTREIGIRMAIGATRSDIRGLILRDGLPPVAVGVIVGVALSLTGNQLLRAQLVGVSPHDPIVMTAAPLILTVIAVAASLLPARRAVAVDPVVALRNE